MLALRLTGPLLSRISPAGGPRSWALARAKTSLPSVDVKGKSPSAYRDYPLEEMGVLYPPFQPSPRECIESVIVEVEGTIAICDGGGGPLGHPVEYIQLNTRYPGEPVACKYCGVKYVSKGGGSHH